jgi:PAS domain S-box-containing protein
MADPLPGHAEILAAVADASDDAIVVTDLDGAVLLWTTAAEQLYGYPRGEVLGRPVRRPRARRTPTARTRCTGAARSA